MRRYLEGGFVWHSGWASLAGSSYVILWNPRLFPSLALVMTAVLLPLWWRIVNEISVQRGLRFTEHPYLLHFFCPLSLVLHKWALPKVTTYNFVSHGEKIIQIFICTPSNLHIVTNYLLANDSYLNSRKLSLRLSYDSLIASQLDLSGNIWHLFWIYLKNSHNSRTRCLLGREKYLRLSELPTVPYITSQGFSVLTKLGLEFCFCFCFCV